MTATTPSNPSDDPLVRIEQKLDSLSSEVDSLSSEVKDLADTVERSNYKFDTYKDANQTVVRLAFTLIASATITVIVSSVLASR